MANNKENRGTDKHDKFIIHIVISQKRLVNAVKKPIKLVYNGTSTMVLRRVTQLALISLLALPLSQAY
jgi:hypothetical protein